MMRLQCLFMRYVEQKTSVFEDHNQQWRFQDLIHPASSQKLYGG